MLERGREYEYEELNPPPPRHVDWPTPRRPYGDEADRGLVRHAAASLARSTGYAYRDLERELSRLSTSAVRDFARLIRDMEHKVTRERRRPPWGRW
jgi:hypothetical protein